MDELRKVQFTLESNVDLGRLDKDKEDSKIRNGNFHRWGEEIIINNGKFFQKTFGIVEGGDKQIYHVVPKRIKFVD